MYSRGKRILCPLLYLALLAFPRQLSADILEWEIVDREIVAEVEGALSRYFAIVRRDSVAIRYLEAASVRLPLKVRVREPGLEEETEIIVIRYGQLQLFESTDIRIALGDRLYQRLVNARDERTMINSIVNLGDPHAHNDWSDDYLVILSFFERVDLRIADRMNLFLQLGAPESNRDFWSDGTFRVGLAGPVGELAFLFPFAGGSQDFGPLPGRRVSPGIGAFALVRSRPLEITARFTLPYSGSLTSTRPIDEVYVPLVSAAASVDVTRVKTAYGSLMLKAGLSYQEVAKVVDQDGNDRIIAGRERQFGPVAELIGESENETVLFSIGTRFLALRTEATFRITSALWFDLRFTVNGLVHDLAPYEPRAAFFFTPRVKF